MILTIFIFMSCLGFVLFVLGYVLDIPLLSIIGAVFIFGLGLLVVSDDVQVVNGTEEVYIYGNNFTGYHWDGYNGSSEAPSSTDRNAYLFHKNETKIYEDYDFGGIGSTSFGVIFLLLGAFMFVLSLFNVGD